MDEKEIIETSSGHERGDTPLAGTSNKESGSDSGRESSIDDLPPEAPAAPAPAADGGVWPWLRVFAAWLLFVMCWGPSLAFGTFQSYYEESLLASQSPSNISWIGSVSTTLLIIGGAWAGPFFDRGYLKPLMALGCFIQIFAFMMLSLCTKYYQIFLTQGILNGLGSGLIFVPGVAFVTTSFQKWRALAIGIAATGSSTGGVIFPLFFRNVIDRIGFGWTCRCIAFIQLFCAVIGLGLLYNAPVHKTKPRNLIDVQAFKSLSFTLFFVVNFCQFLAYWIPLFYIPSFAVSELGTSANLAAYFTVFLNATSAFGRILPSFAVQRFGAANVVGVAILLTTILLFCWIGIKTSVAGFIVWSIIFGFVTGTFISAGPVLVSHPVLTPSLDVFGTRIGMLWFAGGIGALIGTPIAGALANPAKQQFLDAQVFAAAIMALGNLCFMYVLVQIWRYDKKAKMEKEEGNV